ncbi:hypothetical protein C1646_748052 [Rhizophagus diaphanus]|nr:hypothetical protein C1646_748052 [Rhizophagus diaphanus] [Rhizophagus sp. MUCL 43196]
MAFGNITKTGESTTQKRVGDKERDVSNYKSTFIFICLNSSWIIGVKMQSKQRIYRIGSGFFHIVFSAKVNYNLFEFIETLTLGITTIRGEQGKLSIDHIARVTVRSEMIPEAFDSIRGSGGVKFRAWKEAPKEEVSVWEVCSTEVVSTGPEGGLKVFSISISDSLRTRALARGGGRRRSVLRRA